MRYQGKEEKLCQFCNREAATAYIAPGEEGPMLIGPRCATEVLPGIIVEAVAEQRSIGRKSLISYRREIMEHVRVRMTDRFLAIACKETTNAERELFDLRNRSRHYVFMGYKGSDSSFDRLVMRAAQRCEGSKMVHAKISAKETTMTFAFDEEKRRSSFMRAVRRLKGSKRNMARIAMVSFEEAHKMQKDGMRKMVKG